MSHMWNHPTRAPGPLRGLRTGPVADFIAANPQHGQQMSQAIRSREPATYPKIWANQHYLPEDVRIAFANAPGKETDGTPTEPAILHERLRGRALECLDNGVVEALAAFKANPADRKAYSWIGAVPLQGEQGAGHATQYDCGNVVYPLVVAVLLYLVMVDSKKRSLGGESPSARSSTFLDDLNLEHVADHAEAVLGVAMYEGGGGYQDKHPWKTDSWKLDRSIPNQKIAILLMKLVASVSDLLTIQPHSIDKDKRTDIGFCKQVMEKWCKIALEAHAQTATPTLRSFMQQRREPAVGGKKCSAEGTARRKNRDKNRLQWLRSQTHGEASASGSAPASAASSEYDR